MKRKAKRVNPAYPGRVKKAVKAERELAQAIREQGRRKLARENAARAADGKPEKAVRVKRKHLSNKSTDAELAAMGLARMGNDIMLSRKFGAPTLMDGVLPGRRIPAPLPGEQPHFALDSAQVAPTYAWANQYCSQVGFPGYPYLAQQALRSEYRAPAETTAKEMTRRWVKFKSASAGDKADKIAKIEELWRLMKIRDKTRTAIYNDMIFGRYQLFMDIKGEQSDIARQRPINFMAGLGKDCLLGIQGIEPMWTTPYSYNSIDPTRQDFYKPVSWFVLGRKTHASRLLDIVSRPVPDLFKPAYNFGGLSMTQLMEPYVGQWYGARDSVANVMRSFSTSGIATNLSTLLEEEGAKGSDGQTLENRAALFNQYKANNALLITDKDTEEFFQFNVPLGTLDKLMAQFQEHMAAPSHTPLVKLLGVSPAGLNASSEGEIKVYYDWIHSECEAVLNDPLIILLVVSQWHLFGAYDPDIVMEWVPMDEPTQKELSEIRAADQAAGSGYIADGVITNEEERERLQSDPQSGYSNLNGPPPDTTPEEDLQNSSQEHASGEADADREHASTEGEVGREHEGEQKDKDRKLTEKTAVIGAKAKAAAKKKAPKGTK